MSKTRWIKAATSNAHGQFKAKAEAAGKSTAAFAEEHDGDGGTLGREARLAETLSKMSHRRSTKTMRNKLYGSKE